MNRHELHELISSCRPDLSDLTEEQVRALTKALEQDADLRAEREAVQAWDVAIARGMHDVPIPDGLAERLIASVTADALPTPARPVRSRSWFSLRLAAAVLGVAALGLLAIGLFLRDGVQTAQVVELCRSEWIAQLDQEAWQSGEAPLAGFPLDPGVRLTETNVQWQDCSAIIPWPAVAYRSQLPPDHSYAFLFVVRIQPWDGRQLPPMPPTVPDSTTGGVCIGVWKSGGYLYVLVVPGTQRKYRDALRTDSVA
jgi:hypothetical protein